MSYFQLSEGKSYKNVNKQQLKDLIDELKDSEERKIYVIDVRNSSEIEKTGKLEHSGVTAVNVPLSSLSSALQLDSDNFEEKYGFCYPDKKNDVIVFTCARGVRSSRASGLASKQGFLNVANYTGGANDWFNQGCVIN